MATCSWILASVYSIFRCLLGLAPTCCFTTSRWGPLYKSWNQQQHWHLYTSFCLKSLGQIWQVTLPDELINELDNVKTIGTSWQVHFSTPTDNLPYKSTDNLPYKSYILVIRLQLQLTLQILQWPTPNLWSSTGPWNSLSPWASFRQ